MEPRGVLASQPVPAVHMESACLPAACFLWLFSSMFALDSDHGRPPWPCSNLERKTEPEDSVSQLQAGHGIRDSSGLYRKERDGAAVGKSG